MDYKPLLLTINNDLMLCHHDYYQNEINDQFYHMLHKWTYKSKQDINHATEKYADDIMQLT